MCGVGRGPCLRPRGKGEMMGALSRVPIAHTCTLFLPQHSLLGPQLTSSLQPCSHRLGGPQHRPASHAPSPGHTGHWQDSPAPRSQSPAREASTGQSRAWIGRSGLPPLRDPGAPRWGHGACINCRARLSYESRANRKHPGFCPSTGDLSVTGAPSPP